MSARPALAATLLAAAALAIAAAADAQGDAHARPALGPGGRLGPDRAEHDRGLRRARPLARAQRHGRGHHACAWAAAAARSRRARPLAVLAARASRRRARASRCATTAIADASPANSAQLFVYSLGGEANSGQNGWEYKVRRPVGHDRRGRSERADRRRPAPALGRPGAVVLVRCDLPAAVSARLTLRPAGATVAARRLAGRDRRRLRQRRPRRAGGRARSSRSARDFASTAGNGRATLVAPSAPGRYPLSAARRGLVPSFPETIVVR